MIRHAILLLAFVVVFAADASAQSQSQGQRQQENSASNQANADDPPPLNEPQADDKGRAENHRQDQGDQGFDGVVRRLTADPAMAILTLGLLIFAGWQVHLSRDTARRQLRAYVIIRDTRVTLDAKGDWDKMQFSEGKITAHITGTNCGATPAKSVCAGAAVVLAPEGAANKLQPLTLEGKYSTDWGTGDGPPLTAIGVLNADQMRRILKGEARVYINGAFEYRDIFRRSHYTRFRFTIDVAEGEKLPQAYACTEGNEAT